MFRSVHSGCSPLVNIVPLAGRAKVAEFSVSAGAAALSRRTAAGVDLATYHVGCGIVAGNQNCVPAILIVSGCGAAHAGVLLEHHDGEVANGAASKGIKLRSSSQACVYVCSYGPE